MSLAVASSALSGVKKGFSAGEFCGGSYCEEENLDLIFSSHPPRAHLLVLFTLPSSTSFPLT